MPAGYVRAWISFLEALDHVEWVAGCARQEACDGLLAALLDGAVESRSGNTREAIDPAKWRLAEVCVPGSVFFPADPNDRSRLGRVPANLPIELRREHVELIWSAASAIMPNLDQKPPQVPKPSIENPTTDAVQPSEVTTERATAPMERRHQPEDTSATVPSGIRTTTAEKAEAKCREWIANRPERPRNKEAAFDDAKAAVARFGPLSQKAFNRAWEDKAPSHWKKPGRRRGT